MKAYVIEHIGDSWVLRVPGGHAQPLAPTLGSARNQAFEHLRQSAPCRIRVSIETNYEEWILWHADHRWILNWYPFERDGVWYVCESKSPGESPCWFVWVDGDEHKAFPAAFDDSDDLPALEDRIVEWWNENQR